MNKNHVKATATIGLALIGIGFGFQNCSKVDVKDLSSATPIGTAGTQSIVGNPTTTSTTVPSVTSTTTPLMSACDQAQSRLIKKTVDVFFDDPGKQCDWGKNGNSMQNCGNYTDGRCDGKIMARTEQFVTVTPPAAGATICSITLTNVDSQNFRYDDNIFVTLNDYVLASTSNFSQHLTQTQGYYKYDWLQLINQAAQNNASNTTPDKQYCAGSAPDSYCLFPQTETVGKVQLQFSDRIIQGLLSITNANQIKLGMITTGDNDSTDCQHVPLHFSVDILYF